MPPHILFNNENCEYKKNAINTGKIFNITYF